MSRERLIAEARAAGRAAKHNLKWMKKYPERYEASNKERMQSYLRMLIRFEAYEKKNARLAGRTSVWTRFKDRFVSIIPHSKSGVVVK